MRTFEISALGLPATCVCAAKSLCTWGDGTTSHRPVLAAAGVSLPPPVCSLSVWCLRASEEKRTRVAGIYSCIALLGIASPPGSWRLGGLPEMRRRPRVRFGYGHALERLHAGRVCAYTARTRRGTELDYGTGRLCVCTPVVVSAGPPPPHIWRPTCRLHL